LPIAVKSRIKSYLNHNGRRLAILAVLGGEGDAKTIIDQSMGCLESATDDEWALGRRDEIGDRQF
jgi:hypothetical protein